MPKGESREVNEKRWYPCPKCGADHPSSTTLLGVMGSKALMGWMAKNGTAKLNVLASTLRLSPHIMTHQTEEVFAAAEMAWQVKETTAFWKSGKQSGSEAADEGIMADAWLEAHFNGVDIDIAGLSPKAQEMVQNALRWEKEHDVKTLFTQRTFYNCKLNYAGTCDWAGTVDGELCILDWKRSGKFYFNHVMQGWSYALADESEGSGRHYPKIGIGSLGKAIDPITFFKRDDVPSAATARDVIIACGHLFEAQQQWDIVFPYKRKPKIKGESPCTSPTETSPSSPPASTFA